MASQYAASCFVDAEIPEKLPPVVKWLLQLFI